MGQQLRMPFAPPEEGLVWQPGIAALITLLASIGTHHEHAYIHTYKLHFVLRQSLIVYLSLG